MFLSYSFVSFFVVLNRVQVQWRVPNLAQSVQRPLSMCYSGAGGWNDRRPVRRLSSVIDSEHVICRSTYYFGLYNRLDWQMVVTRMLACCFDYSTNFLHLCLVSNFLL